MKIRVKFVASVMTTMNTKKLGLDVIMKTVVDGTTIGVLAFDGKRVHLQVLLTTSCLLSPFQQNIVNYDLI